jgi:predicted esterase
VKTISIETRTHGRIVVKEAARTPAACVVGFHGYAQSAEEMLDELALIPGSDKWTLASVQALHRFYARRQEKVVASWMTRQDRELAIADNLLYVNRAIRAVLDDAGTKSPAAFIGFSQGVAMAYRAAVCGERRPGCVIAIGGDVPPDVKSEPVERFPAILIAAGRSDEWYTEEKLQADENFLRAHGANVEVFRYSGGHEWTPELRGRIREQIGRILHLE